MFSTSFYNSYCIGLLGCLVSMFVLHVMFSYCVDVAHRAFGI